MPQLTKNQAMTTAGKVIDFSYEVVFNGKCAVEVTTESFVGGWCGTFAITLTPPDSSSVSKMLTDFLKELKFVPFENCAVFEDNVSLAEHQMAQIIGLLDGSIVDENQTHDLEVPESFDGVFLLSIRPIPRYSFVPVYG